MLNVCDYLLLIVLTLCELLSHIGKRCGKVSYLIITVDCDLIVQVSGCILFRCSDDAAQRKIYKFRKENEYYQ